MAVTVPLQDVIAEMVLLSDETHAYLNRLTGELVTIRDEEISAIESHADLQNYPEWQRDLIDKTREVLYSDDYLPLPSKFDIHEYAIMERFCYAIEDPDLSRELLSQIRGSGAFRRFKDAMYRHAIEHDWYRYRDQALEQIAIDWLEENGIAFSRDEGTNESREA